MPLRNYNGREVEVCQEGHLVNFEDWDEDLAYEIAREEGIELTERHWQLINLLRNHYSQKHQVPTLRYLTKQSGIGVKELYELFPNGPLKKAARVAGLPKPQSCV